MKRSRVFCLLLVLAISLCAAGSLRAAPGDMLWPNPQTFNFPDCDTILIAAVAASSSSLIVCGTAFNSAMDTGDLGFIKAFDVATGQLKWQDTLTTGANRNGFDSLTVVGNTVLVDGYSSSYTQGTYILNKSTLRAYNADTGSPESPSLLWEVVKDGASLNGGPTNIITANNRVFVVRQEKGFNLAGTGYDTGSIIVEAYQVGVGSVAPMSLLLE